MSGRRSECLDENSVIRIKPSQIRGVRMYYPIVTKSTQFPLWFGLSEEEAQWARSTTEISGGIPVFSKGKTVFEADDTGKGDKEAAEMANRNVKYLCDAKFSAILENSRFEKKQKVRLKE